MILLYMYPNKGIGELGHYVEHREETANRLSFPGSGVVSGL